jgi:hypothetical protein
MIVNTGGRTDTVQYYHKWLISRFKEGYVLVRNPLFPGRISKYQLDPAIVDCVVFCSKNYAPILEDLSLITDRFPAYFYYTITPYGKDIEPGVPDIPTSIETLKKLSRLVGKQRVAWRYDSVLLTENYTIESHLASIEAMTKEIAPYAERCIFSFVEMYKRLEKNMPELIAFNEEQKEFLARSFGQIAAK